MAAALCARPPSEFNSALKWERRNVLRTVGTSETDITQNPWGGIISSDRPLRVDDGAGADDAAACRDACP
jgi:hypothetical protein